MKYTQIHYLSIIQSLQDLMITLILIPSHVGISGNEDLGQTAKYNITTKPIQGIQIPKHNFV